MKKSIAALLAIALVLTSLFALNLIASAEGEDTTPSKLVQTNTENPQSYDNQGALLKGDGSVTQINLNSNEPLYSAGYTTVTKYVYAGTTTATDYKKQLSPKRNLSTEIDISNSRSTTYLRTFVRVPQDTQIKFWLANGWEGKDSIIADVKSVNGGAGYFEVIVPLANCTNTTTFKNIFVGLASYEEAAKIKQIYISSVEVWNGRPTEVLTAAQEKSPEWLLTTNNYINKPDSVKTSNYSTATEKNVYWQNVSAATVTEFTFDSQENMETYYSTSEREFRFQVNQKDGYISSALTGLEAPLNMSNFEGAYISMWIKAPKNMQFDISTCNSNWGRPYSKVTVNVTEANNGWQEVRIPITDNTTAYNLSSVVVRPAEATDYATTWNYGESLYISWPQIVKNVEFSDGSALAEDTVAFGESVEDTYIFSSGKANGLTTTDATLDGKNGVQITMSDAETYYATQYGRDRTHIWFKNGVGTLTQNQYDYGYLKFYVKTSKAIELAVARYDQNYQQMQVNTTAISVAASEDGFTEVIVPISQMGINNNCLANRNYLIAPSKTSHTNKTFLAKDESVFISDIELCVDMTKAAITEANTITAEQTDDISTAENGFTGLRKLTVKDSGFYTLADADRAITHTFGSTVNQADVDYLGFWVKAPKAMTLKLIFTDSYGVAVTTDVAVNGTLKQGGYQFVTLSREQLKLNYLADIVSLTLTPATTAEEFLSENEALYYSAFTLYSGKPVSFYESYKTGDANGNGTVDIRDLVRARAATDITYAADVIENGKIDSADMVAFRNILLGIE
ncbi:MAG: dockerin type I repeat-containing protein [Acutalibacteraceae bacterium]|nr:dockerin type I repeat-containing protein [Acutalibacteraceae bacterium]